MNVDGFAAPGFGPVLDALARALGGAEQGAALTVLVDGEPVVDAWGGFVEGSRTWQRDTAGVAFSATKGLAVLCAQLLVERGLLSLDAPVARYWPEFAAAGKSEVLVRHVLSHRAGVLTFPRYWEVVGPDGDALADGELISRHLAAAPASWPAGARFKYTPLTFGYLLGELVRRIDGRSLGRFFADEIADPLKLSTWIGLPESERHRVALPVEAGANGAARPERLDAFTDAEARRLVRAGRETDPAASAYAGLFLHPDAPATAGHLTGLLRRHGLLAAELPACNAVTTARSLAGAYAVLAGSGELHGTRLIGGPVIEAFAQPQPPAVGYGVGYQRLSVPRSGRGGAGRVEAVGHSGAGGSLGFADLGRRLAFGYVKNRMLRLPTPTYQMIHAVYRCLDRS